MKKKEIENLEQAGADYVADWLCWNEKQLAALQTIKEKENYIHQHGNFESCASDMGMYNDHCNRRPQIEAECAADYIYEGMVKRVKGYLSKFNKEAKNV